MPPRSPRIFALSRARKFLDSHRGEGISLVVTGGFRVSPDFAKALALGADAVAIGTAALMACGCQQYRICNTGKCPVGVTTQNPDLRDRLKIDISARKLELFLRVCTEELKDFARLTGNADVHRMDIFDLCYNELGDLGLYGHRARVKIEERSAQKMFPPGSGFFRTLIGAVAEILIFYVQVRWLCIDCMQRDSEACKEHEYRGGMDCCSGINGFFCHYHLSCAVCQCNRDLSFTDIHYLYLRGANPPGLTPLPTCSEKTVK